MHRISMLGALATAMTAMPVTAQDWLPGTSPMTNVGRMNVITSGAINSAVSRKAFRYRSGTGRAAAASAGGGAAGAAMGLASRSASMTPGTARRVALPYRSTAASQAQAKAEFLQRLRGNNPEAANAIAPELAKNNMDSIFRGIVSPFGLSSADAGDVMTAYIVLGWMIANSANDPSPAGVRAARAEIGSLLAQSGAIADPATRTKVAEEVKILFVTLHAGWQSAQKEGKTGQYANGVAQLFRTATGDDLRRMTLTDQGFRRRG